MSRLNGYQDLSTRHQGFLPTKANWNALANAHEKSKFTSAQRRNKPVTLAKVNVNGKNI